MNGHKVETKKFRSTNGTENVFVECSRKLFTYITYRDLTIIVTWPTGEVNMYEGEKETHKVRTKEKIIIQDDKVVIHVDIAHKYLHVAARNCMVEAKPFGVIELTRVDTNIIPPLQTSTHTAIPRGEYYVNLLRFSGHISDLREADMLDYLSETKPVNAVKKAAQTFGSIIDDMTTPKQEPIPEWNPSWKPITQEPIPKIPSSQQEKHNANAIYVLKTEADEESSESSLGKTMAVIGVVASAVIALASILLGG